MPTIAVQNWQIATTAYMTTNGFSARLSISTPKPGTNRFVIPASILSGRVAAGTGNKVSFHFPMLIAERSSSQLFF